MKMLETYEYPCPICDYPMELKDEGKERPYWECDRCGEKR